MKPKADTPHLARLVGIVGSQRRVAAALGMSERYMSLIARGVRKEPRWFAVLAEMLDALPPKDRPERWKR